MYNMTKRTETQLANQKRYHAKNREAELARMKEYREANREELSAKQQKRRKDIKLRKEQQRTDAYTQLQQDRVAERERKIIAAVAALPFGQQEIVLFGK